MTCEGFEEYITEYLEGRLTPEQHAEVENHRMTCEACQSLTASVAEIVNTCHSLPKQEPQADLASKIIQKTPHKGQILCEGFEEYITDYLEGTLAHELREKIENHRARCQDCRSLATLVSQISDICHAQPKLDPSAVLIGQILGQTPRKERSRFTIKASLQRLFQPVFWPKVAVGAALMIGFLSLGINILSDKTAFKKVDQFAHQIYGQGVKIYDRTNQWQAQMKFLTESLRNRFSYEWRELQPAPRKEETPPPQKKDPEKRGSGRAKAEASRVL